MREGYSGGIKRIAMIREVFQTVFLFPEVAESLRDLVLPDQGLFPLRADDDTGGQGKGDKIAFVGSDVPAKTTLFQILAGEMKPDSGSFRWGATITPAYFPKENSAYFRGDLNRGDHPRRGD